jgi:hypothetical protein
MMKIEEEKKGEDDNEGEHENEEEGEIGRRMRQRCKGYWFL